MDLVSFQAWKRRGFPGLSAGDTILTTKPGHWVTWALVFFQSVVKRRAVIWRHAMRYKGQGMALSQEKVHREASLEDWVGQTIRVYSNPAYTEADRRHLVEQSEAKLGRLYDGLGILGQVARCLPLVGEWLAGVIQVSALNYCSEGHCEDERTRRPAFRKGKSCKCSPDDIDEECNRLGDLCWTFKLVP